jgi:hypothetical protein
VILAMLANTAAPAQQIIDFESGGLKYHAMTRNGITVMFSVLATRIRDYAILQMAISNGSPISWTVKPEDCTFEKSNGQKIQGLAARTVVNGLIDKAGRGDVIS